MKIGNKEIGNDNHCYIIAEAGVNHNGDMNLAKKLVDAAVDANVDAVKFQTFKAELIVTEEAKQANYQTENIGREESQFDMLKRLELTEENFAELKNYCDEKSIEFLSTPHSDEWSVDVIEHLGVKAYKIGSGDLTNLPMLRYIAKKKKPMILPTGMANLEEIKEAKKAVVDEGNDELILLQCTTMYPTPLDKTNLNFMLDIKKKLGGVVGFSDHTQGIEAGIISVCLGSSLYEKHFTLDNDMEGPDHKASINPSELKKMVSAIRFVEKEKITDPYVAFERLNNELGYNLNKNNIKIILGMEEKVPLPEELEIAKVARKSLVALKDINQGDILTKDNFGIRRPGEGLAPKYYDEIIGKTAKAEIKKNEYIKLEDV